MGQGCGLASDGDEVDGGLVEEKEEKEESRVKSRG